MPSKSISKLTELQFAKVFSQQLLPSIKEDPIQHFVKADGFLSFNPTFAQEVALKCVFSLPLSKHVTGMIVEEHLTTDKVFSLQDRFLSETDLFLLMTGKVYDPYLQVVRNRIDLIVGRRGGKSTISALLAVYAAIKINWNPYLQKTPSASVVVLSHSRDLSEEILEIMRKFFEESEVLTRLIDREKKFTQSTFNLKVPFIVNGKIEYSKVTIKVGTASKKTIRGRAICALLCDEIAYWNLDEKAVEQDVDILRAARPSLLQFGDEGLLIKLSSPGIKQGILYEEYQNRDNLPDSYIIFKAPSWVWNPRWGKKVYEEEYKLDPIGFASEYRADFVDSISSFILPEFVDLCTMTGKSECAPETGKDVHYEGAIDAAFKGDRFTFSLVGGTEHRVKQYEMLVWEGSPLTPVKAYEVATKLREVCKKYGLSRIHADQFAFQPLLEIFDKFGMTLVEKPFTNVFKRQIYFNLKNLIHNQRIDLLDHEIMRSEIKQLQVEQTATGTVKIGHPPGGKDDCADSLAIATFIVSENLNKMQVSMTEWAGMEGAVKVDSRTGRALVAPSPATLAADYFNKDFVDNSGLYEKDEKTGRLKKSDDDDDKKGGGGGFNFSF